METLALGILCLFVAFQGYMIMHLMKRIFKMEDILKSMNHDLNMVNKTIDNQKQILRSLIKRIDF